MVISPRPNPALNRHRETHLVKPCQRALDGREVSWLPDCLAPAVGLIEN